MNWKESWGAGDSEGWGRGGGERGPLVDETFYFLFGLVLSVLNFTSQKQAIDIQNSLSEWVSLQK